MQSPWELIAQKAGYPGEKEFWIAKYLGEKKSLTDLAGEYACSVNQIRSRLLIHNIELRKRGGPNNTKVLFDKDLVQDIIEMGIRAAAKKRGLKPQLLYQRLYYKYNVTLKQLREAQSAPPPAVECEDAPPSSEESLPSSRGDK